MYTFQEVHEHTAGMGDVSNKTYWKVVHEDTLLWIRYYSLGKLPEGVLPWVFETWEGLTDEQRKEAFKMKVLLGNCTATTPIFPEKNTTYGEVWSNYVYNKKQGNNPMAYNTASATILSSPTQSDESIQRGYLLQMLGDYNRYSWKEDTKYAELRKLFNMYAPTRPGTTQGVLDAIKNGKFTVDQKKLDAQQKWTDAGRDGWGGYDEDLDGNDSPYDVFYGLIFTDIPKEDLKGYEAAVKAYEAEVERTKRRIIIGTPADGLAALEALEAWLPTGKAN